ncbi:hypothetical protein YASMINEVIRUS_1056 [Yasminevirus sp. GU-2018]|uniref:C2H2-type domain-containing protein n=1 Tax=Yasminevirus sp. GU-2018 TaxID=2420051 RepID=A0A5K0UAT8_9VIRU|nr:hypothetical protein YASMINEVIRUS_1056 [Yasminevirus sp. GU-2018]
MSELLCPNCAREFPRKRNLDNHLAKNACKQYAHFCKLCEKGFTTETSMYRHVRTSCKVKKENDNEKSKIYERLVEIEAKYKEIEQENKKLTKRIKTMQTVIGGENHNISINNGTVNNHNTNNIILVGYGQEDLSKLDKAEILKDLQNGYYSTVKLTEAVHFNPKYPEYHNVYISNMKDKYAMMHDGKRWTLTMKEDLINQIYEDKKNYIEENLEDFIDSLTPSRRRALERWLDTDDDDKKIKEIKDSIKLLLYNSRQLPLKNIESSLETVVVKGKGRNKEIGSTTVDDVVDDNDTDNDNDQNCQKSRIDRTSNTLNTINHDSTVNSEEKQKVVRRSAKHKSTEVNTKKDKDVVRVVKRKN